MPVLASRLLRKIGLNSVTFNFRDRAMLGIVSKLHLESIHQLRSFSVGDYYSGNIDPSKPHEPFENLASSYRNVLADFLELPPQKLHCTIKICQGDETLKKKKWKVYTIARSTPCSRPSEYGPDICHTIGNNSSFAPLVGCDDRKNIWGKSVYSCFSCNDLPAIAHKYDDTRTNWQEYYKASLVFPLRYKQNRKINVTGFITFDSDKLNAFRKMPNIFDYQKNPSDFEEKLSYSSIYHIGGMLADITATTLYLNER